MNQFPVKKFSTRQRLKSFAFAFRGIRYFFWAEHNAKIHGLAAIFVVSAAVVFKVTGMEMIAILIAIALVWISEMFNTAIERIMNHLSPAIHPDVKIIKDISAAAVLVSSCIALIIALIIFIPKL